jgi:hypothetical protein
MLLLLFATSCWGMHESVDWFIQLLEKSGFYCYSYLR